MTITINGTTGLAGVDGSAGTPAIQGADTNTGVFFPAADTVGITTGGSERMRVDSSGNLQLSAVGTSLLNSSGRKILNQTGSVLQIIIGTTSTQVTTTSATFVDTGLSATITPSSTSSKILIFVSQNGIMKGATANVVVSLSLVRTSTEIQRFGYPVGYTNAANYWGGGQSTAYLDSPATTSATTYKTQVSISGGATVDVQRDNIPTSTIILMEIAG